MLGLCSHEFLWPRRAASGGYYQSCILCGAEYEYDWRRMRRMGRRDGKPETTPTPTPLRSNLGPESRTAPRLKLLLEAEPAHRVFFRNLADLLLHRSRPPVAGASRPGAFWRDVFVDSDVPWRWFLESMLGHVITVTVVVILCQVWPLPEPSQQRRIFDQSYISYYRPSQAFPALRSGRSRAPAPSKKLIGSGHQSSIRVRSESIGRTVNPPDIKLTAPGQAHVVASNPALPAMPLSATSRSQLNVPAGPTSVVAPPPVVSQAMARQLGLPQASVVAPPADPRAISSRPAMAALRANAVAPPPILQGSMPGSTNRIGDLNIGHSEIVGPAPRLPVEEQRASAGMAQSILGRLASLVVPPPPSMQRSETLGAGTLANGPANPWSGAGLQVVPPPPSVQGAGNSAAGGQANSLFGTNLSAVPPPPLVQGAGNSGGGGRANSLSGTNLQVVAPPPSIEGNGNSGGGGRAGSLSNAGLQGVPPASGGGNSIAGEGAGESAAGEAEMTADANHVGTPPKDDGNANEPATEELPLRLIGLALALPNSSYFSNYEVFIAERAISKVGSQLIKLVYVSLPYQRRLSEYGLGVYKLRVRRDSTCDESLLEMTWPETDPRPDAHRAGDAPALSQKDRNQMLPCYRTTADDNRKVLSRVH